MGEGHLMIILGYPIKWYDEGEKYPELFVMRSDIRVTGSSVYPKGYKCLNCQLLTLEWPYFREKNAK
jgi:hypothetical protein